MTYKKRFYTEDEWKEITREHALNTVLGTFRDNEATRAMLTIGNRIRCRYSEILVIDENGNTAPEGEFDLIPEEYMDDRYFE